MAKNLTEKQKYQLLPLGGCKNIRQVVDIVRAAKVTPNVLFHSLNLSYELIDFLYQDDVGAFHAFQATTGMRHSTDPVKIKQLEKDIGIENKLSIYYLVPGENFVKFRTSP